MDWLKRNMLLVVSAAVALALVGGAGFYLYTKIAAEQDVEAKLAEKRTELQGLQTKNPYPNQENLNAVKQQQKLLLDFLVKARGRFGRFSTNSAIQYNDFGAWLARNLADMQRLAAEAHVTVTNGFAFSFTAQKDTLQYDRASLIKVITQVEDVYSICELLFQAKINELLSVQRAQVATNDQTSGFMSPNEGDYVQKGIWNTNVAPPAVISPYEVTFRCSSVELANVMESLAKAPNGFNVKWIKVENGEVQTSAEGEVPTPATPVSSPYNRYGRMTPEMMKRYGIDPRYGMMRRAPVPQPESVAPTPPPSPTKLGRILTERLIKVTLYIDTIKSVVVKP